jgi:hypothetical protein
VRASGFRPAILLLAAVLSPLAARAQIDPDERELIQFGYNQPINGQAPLAAYAFYYYTEPDFLCESNLTLRLALAPVYLDSELGISHALGPNTDLGIGLAGGGFADSYYEVRQGQYLPSESFTGNGGTLSTSIYHLFDPGRLIPLNGVLRGEVHYANYERDSDTDPNFSIPGDLTSFNVRTGFRFGGMEPLIAPDVAMELSLWYEGQFRENYGYYGYPVGGSLGDRQVEAVSHLFWGRALLAYTLPASRDNFQVSLTAGTSASPDRFSAYRLGGLLPLASEFPLSLPGYYYQEISASRFALLYANNTLPLDAKKRWAVSAVGSVAVVNYLPGLEQPGPWNSGVGGGISYRSTSGAWQIMLDYGYGFQAIRDTGRGAQSVGLLIQFNLIPAKSEYYDPGDSPFVRGLDKFLHSFD